MSDLIAYLLSSVGATILIVWPEAGPTAWLRDRRLRRVLPPAMQGILDCYVCFGFWTGLALSPAWWAMTGEHWPWFGCLMVPGIFWVILQLTPHSVSQVDTGTEDEMSDDQG